MIDSNTIIVISDTSLKDNVTISISHVHFHLEQVKTVHYTVNIMMIEAELFAIRCNKYLVHLCIYFKYILL